MNATTKHLQARVTEARIIGGHTNLLFLAPVEGAFPSFTAGSHLDIEVPGIGPRSYSLANDPSNTDRYVLAVRRELRSRGGSQWICNEVKTGDVLTISEPRNHFPLDETAEHTVLVAGGIGITPLLSMAYRLTALGKPWSLYYSSRSADQLVLLEVFEDLATDPSQVTVNITSESPRLDLAQLIADHPGSHFYCCGPVPMLDTLVEAGSDIPERIHVEYFEPTEQKATEHSYDIEIASTGERLHIPAGRTILDVLLENGHDEIEYSCSEGTCGTCEVGIVSGRPDHRDVVLTKSEKESGQMLMVCCSGSKDPLMVLDL